MKRLNEADIGFRQGGNFGSKYLHRGENYELGKIVVPPKKRYDEYRHRHEKTEELFWFLQGEPLFFIDEQKIRVREGDVYVIEPGEVHNLVNDTDKECLIVFAKSPRLEGDRFEIMKETCEI